MNQAKKYTTLLLPLIFILYLGNLVAFTHVHIENGVTIVHSHPFQKNEDGTPKEKHNCAEFQLLHQISTIQINGPIFPQTLITVFLSVFLFLFSSPICQELLRPDTGSLLLRAPPALSTYI